ncbi:hypothetical protein K7X08_023465 [Anisodus acutangulus]|uniref:Uncharacterized protein n=1 Tax=Anisodus acutangulus TaxID=402998 RepID=A0A9Q1LI12_9SOLA|nr:hypothetical protein K7X08_023465 [Anisodus acutangulus]
MPFFLPHRISPPNKLVVLNQTCLDLPTTSSEWRKWGDDEEEEVADNEESSGGLQKGKEPVKSQIADDMNESIEDNSNEDGYAQITMDFREPRSPIGSIDSDTPIVRLDANILHPRALRMLGFTTKEGIEYEDMTEALTAMFTEPPMDNRVIAKQKAIAAKQPERSQEVHTQCVELPTSCSERRKWGDDCNEEEADSNEDGYARITMDFIEPRSPIGSIDSDTPIVRFDANILHPRALRMLEFTTNEEIEYEDMAEALTSMFTEPPEDSRIEENGNEGKKKDEGKKGVEHKQKEKPFKQSPPHQLKSGKVVGNFNTWTTKEAKNKGKQKNHTAKGGTDQANETGNNAQTNKFAALREGEENNTEENLEQTSHLEQQNLC